MTDHSTGPDFTGRPNFGPGVYFPPNKRPMPFERNDAAPPAFTGRPQFGPGVRFTPQPPTFGQKPDDAR
ncbi:hypothetical protein KZX18_00600 [Micrococcus luteus]|uniref:hypothetical protein n=1 Tax=Micrococcus luteus TaxID=1270 RepID=UPI0020033169|nr:hypothetical protein [Micrococcus luteus]MCK6108481.1 hypothetical protein [Micrococcus luteus]